VSGAIGPSVKVSQSMGINKNRETEWKAKSWGESSHLARERDGSR